MPIFRSGKSREIFAPTIITATSTIIAAVKYLLWGTSAELSLQQHLHRKRKSRGEFSISIAIARPSSNKYFVRFVHEKVTISHPSSNIIGAVLVLFPISSISRQNTLRQKIQLTKLYKIATGYLISEATVIRISRTPLGNRRGLYEARNWLCLCIAYGNDALYG